MKYQENKKEKGHTSTEDCVEESIQELEDYIKKSKDRQIAYELVISMAT